MPATKRILHAINNNGMAPVILSPQTNVYNITQQGRGGGVFTVGSSDDTAVCSELLRRRRVPHASDSCPSTAPPPPLYPTSPALST